MSFGFRKDEIGLDKSLRKELGLPLGPVVHSIEEAADMADGKSIYAVGDVTVKTLLDIGVLPKVAIFDYRTERHSSRFPIIIKSYRRPIAARNKAGTLSKEMWNAVRRASRMDKPVGIKVTGEEDLAGLACIYFADDGDFVMYGLRKKGVVVIKVGSRIKARAERILKRMSGI